MKRKQRKLRVAAKQDNLQPYWLPIDYRLVPDLFRFSYVRGWAKVFLQLEMILSVSVVLGTMFLVAVHFLSGI